MTEVSSEEKKAVERLTEWPNEPSVNDLKADLLEASSHHNTEIARIDTYLANLNPVPKKTTDKKTKSKPQSTLEPKLIRKQAEWRYAALSEPFLSTDDLFNIEPVAADDVEAAKQNELILNNQFNTRINKVKFIGDYIRSAVNTGTVVCKLGWVLEEEEYEEEEGIFQFVAAEDPAIAEDIQSILAIQQENPSMYQTEVADEWKEAAQLSMQNGVPVEPMQVGTQLVKKTKIIRNHPTVEVCDHRHVIIDPTANGDVTKASFIIYKFPTTLSELRKANKYTNLDSISHTEADYLAVSDSDFEQRNFRFSDKPRQKLVGYEYWGYWDYDNSGIAKPIVATFVGNTMIALSENPFPDKGLPFELVSYLPRFNENYGEPDGELLADNQKIIGALMRGVMDLMGKSANGQVGYAKGILDTANKARFTAGDDYEYNPGVNPESAFHVHKYPEIPQSAFALLQMINNESESLTGVKSFHGGISGQALGNTATGVRSALDATSKRDLEILRRLAEGIKNIGRKIIAMNAVWLADTEVVRITNEQFVAIRRDDLTGNFDLKMAISTAEVDNQKSEELAYMLQTLGPNVDWNITKMMLSEIARLRKMPLLAKQVATFNPQPDPLVVEKAKLELELLRAQIEETRSKAQAALTNAGANQVKTQVDAAKARNLHSDADRKDLDYVEQETGTAQERELEKIKLQGQMKAQDTLLKEKAKAKSKE